MCGSAAVVVLHHTYDDIGFTQGGGYEEEDEDDDVYIIFFRLKKGFSGQPTARFYLFQNHDVKGGSAQSTERRHLRGGYDDEDCLYETNSRYRACARIRSM